MPRVAPLEYDEADPATRIEFDRITAERGRVTNMKRTLAHHPLSMRIYGEWYPLRDQVVEFLGERATLLYVHAISSATDCLICSTYFRRLLIDAGEDPEALVCDVREQAVIDYGRQLARDPNRVSDELYARLSSWLTPAQCVTLTAFGGLMVATNLFNNALQVELDEYLWPYRRSAAETTASAATTAR